MTDRDTTAHGTRYDTGPTVVVTTPEGIGSWNGGVFAGDRGVVAMAERNARIGVVAELLTATFTASDTSAPGAFAAMVADHPGRYRIEQAPPELLDLLAQGPCASLEVDF